VVPCRAGRCLSWMKMGLIVQEDCGLRANKESRQRFSLLSQAESRLHTPSGTRLRPCSRPTVIRAANPADPASSAWPLVPYRIRRFCRLRFPELQGGRGYCRDREHKSTCADPRRGGHSIGEEVRSAVRIAVAGEQFDFPPS